MCGITGAIAMGPEPLRVDRLKGMVDVIAHRGPDDAGYLVWQTGRARGGASHGQALADQEFARISPALPAIDSEQGARVLRGEPWDLFLGHRRLSILDLSPRGHQPMSAADGRLWLVYNGEIYNFPELRDELATLGHSFVSRSDTEVLLHAYAQWGIECVRRFNGMFAFALWDDLTRTLWLARDRCGIKPLYYARVNGSFVFGSEIKSILQYGGETPAVDLLALNEYFSFQNTFSYRTLFDGIRLLPPGSWMEVKPDRGSANTTRYWSFNFTGDNPGRPEDLERELEHLVRRAVQRQCISDVPIGSYLSGGMDSGAVTALAARHMGRILTFTGGFDLSEAASHEMRFDERELAEHMASVFQTEHYECVLHAGDMEAVMEKLTWHLEDLRVGQCYPNYYVARLAGKFVKVVLSGTGGDELFGGYPWRYAAAIAPTHEDYVQNYYKYWKRLISNRDKPRFFHPDIVARLRGMNDDGAVPFVDETLTVFRRVFGGKVETRSLADQINHSLFFECETFLHGLMVVEDKLSMAHSLETRVPLLDNELVDFACTIPVQLKISGFDHLELVDENLLGEKDRYKDRIQSGKNILRRAMTNILPPEVTGARKQGFSAPDESWFRGRAEDFVRATLLDPRARIAEYAHQPFISELLDEHHAGKVNHRLLIWSLISFEQWLKTFIRRPDGRSAP